MLELILQAQKAHHLIMLEFFWRLVLGQLFMRQQMRSYKMITYKLSNNNVYVEKLVDGMPTGEWCNSETNEAYLAWLAEGNKPEPADEVAT